MVGESTGLIYVVSHLATGKKYIGKTQVNARDARWQCHIRDARLGKGRPQSLQAAIREFGESAFTIETLEHHAQNAANREKHYIQECCSLWPNGFNLSSGGEGGKPNRPVYFKGKRYASRALLITAVVGAEALHFRHRFDNHLKGLPSPWSDEAIEEALAKLDNADELLQPLRVWAKANLQRWPNSEVSAEVALPSCLPSVKGAAVRQARSGRPYLYDELEAMGFFDDLCLSARLNNR